MSLSLIAAPELASESQTISAIRQYRVFPSSRRWNYVYIMATNRLGGIAKPKGRSSGGTQLLPRRHLRDLAFPFALYGRGRRQRCSFGLGPTVDIFTIDRNMSGSADTQTNFAVAHTKYDYLNGFADARAFPDVSIQNQHVISFVVGPPCHRELSTNQRISTRLRYISPGVFASKVIKRSGALRG
jgi:hypothetical protein